MLACKWRKQKASEGGMSSIQRQSVSLRRETEISKKNNVSAHGEDYDRSPRRSQVSSQMRQSPSQSGARGAKPGKTNVPKSAALKPLNIQRTGKRKGFSLCAMFRSSRPRGTARSRGCPRPHAVDSPPRPPGPRGEAGPRACSPAARSSGLRVSYQHGRSGRGSCSQG